MKTEISAERLRLLEALYEAMKVQGRRYADESILRWIRPIEQYDAKAKEGK